MKPSRFTEEQIIGILRKQEAGSKTADVCRKHGISGATFYKWKAKYGGLDVSDAKRLKALEDENAKLKKLLAEAMTDDAVAIVISTGTTIDFCFMSKTIKSLPQLSWLRKGMPVPQGTATALLNASAIGRLQGICERLSPKFRAEKIIARQACFRPVTEDGLPLIGKVPRSAGAYVAAGHTVWGILNAAATGEALAELIADGAAQHRSEVLRSRPAPAARPVAAAS